MISLTSHQWIAFGIMSIFIVLFSKHVLFKPKSHGFYRFFGWECLAFLLANNYKFWFTDYFSVTQIISWICLLYATYIVIVGGILMIKKGKAHESREDKTLYGFEKTTKLVNTGLYRYIRHPLYGSLVFLAWGIFFKNTDIFLLIISVLATVFFFATMFIEEKENIAYFGEKYSSYMKESKMIIPFLL